VPFESRFNLFQVRKAFIKSHPTIIGKQRDTIAYKPLWVRFSLFGHVGSLDSSVIDGKVESMLMYVMAFQIGNKYSKGKPPSVWADHTRIVEHLLNKYTGDQIRELAADKKRCAKELSSKQEIILIQLANALNAHDHNDNALERERMLDRLIGKPVSRTELTGKNGDALMINVITGVDATEGEFVEVAHVPEPPEINKKLPKPRK
jgi:hypothetical protein